MQYNSFALQYQRLGPFSLFVQSALFMWVVRNGNLKLVLAYTRFLTIRKYRLPVNNVWPPESSGPFCLQNPKVTVAITFGILRYLTNITKPYPLQLGLSGGYGIPI